MNWHADYNLVVADGPSQTNLVDLVGWITMQNQSGKTFENAQIKLMAGDVNKLVEVVPMAKAVPATMDMAERDGPVVAGKIVRRISPVHPAACHNSARSGNQASGIRERQLAFIRNASTSTTALKSPSTPTTILNRSARIASYGTQSNQKSM